MARMIAAALLISVLGSSSASQGALGCSGGLVPHADSSGSFCKPEPIRQAESYVLQRYDLHA